jgi:rRNA maturation RNase YbeY
MILIKNTQRSVSLDIEKIRKDAERILEILKYKDFDLGIWFTSEATIREYNRDYRNKDQATDILSFPFHSELKAGERIKAKHADDKNIGDIIMAPSYIQRDPKNLGGTFEERMQLLLVHGICHLLGYDHETDADFRRMRLKESYILKNLRS